MLSYRVSQESPKSHTVLAKQRRLSTADGYRGEGGGGLHGPSVQVDLFCLLIAWVYKELSGIKSVCQEVTQ